MKLLYSFIFLYSISIYGQYIRISPEFSSNSIKGKNVDVLIETVNDEESIGHTSNYLMVKLPEKLEVGKIYSRVL